MADSYFVSKPTNHLANLATLTQKSALGIEDATAKQVLSDAAKKSQQSQQHGFEMGQIGRKGGLDARNTLLGMGINLPQTLAGQRSSLQNPEIQRQLEQARVAANLNKLSPWVAAMPGVGQKFDPASIANRPLSEVQDALRTIGTLTTNEAKIRSAAAGNPAQAKVDEGTEVTEKEHRVGGKPTGAVERTTKHSRKEQRKLKGNNIDTVARRLGINLNEGETKTIRGTTYSQGQYIPKAGGYLIILPNGTTMFVDENGNTIQRSK
jgi:hypothetical protein